MSIVHQNYFVRAREQIRKTLRIYTEFMWSIEFKMPGHFHCTRIHVG
jgi:hypothetical protein